MVSRKPLPYWLFLVLGGLVTGYSLFVRQTSAVNYEAMTLFAYVGGLFILLGLIKLLARYLKSLSSKEKDLANRLGGVDKINRQEQQIQHPSKNRPTVINCSYCGTKNYSTSNFCHMCGTRIK